MNDEPTAQAPVQPQEFAGLWPRFGSLLGDFLILSLIFFPATRIVKGVWLMKPDDHEWVSGWFITAVSYYLASPISFRFTHFR